MLRRSVTGTAVVLLVLGLAACGSDSDSGSSTTTTPQEAVCADKEALEQSVRDLGNIDLSESDESTLEDQANKIGDELDALGNSVKANLEPEVEALKSAVKDLETALKSFGDQSITTSITEAGDAISKVGSASSDLASKLDAQCSD
jgi:hypothetical protein